MKRRRWDFEYRLPSRGAPADEASDFVVATWAEARLDELAVALGSVDEDVRVDALLVRAPLFWYRVRSASVRQLSDIVMRLAAARVGVRYVTPSTRRDLAIGPRPDFAGSAATSAREWRTPFTDGRGEDESPRHWFLSRNGGVDVDRPICGTGAGTRLAVIDDEVRDADSLDLDAEVLVGVPKAPRGSAHGAAMAAWATGSRGNAANGLAPFRGVAPDAACRLYVIPRPGQGGLWLPLAIVRAVDDGADVVVCATYVENTTSPLLDDALEFAVRLGRRGLGTAVVLPTGREISSPAGSVHASLTLDFADPASDPRVLCVAPSGKNGGWFFWTDKTGKRRPFANRGPAVRIAAPGDDMAYPFAKDGRAGHAESSGASAIAAGVALLVLGKNPTLRVGELYGLLTSTATECPTDPEGPVGDEADLLPEARDPDGHDAKTGFGRVSALRACLAASDPIAAALLEIGEEDAARRFVALRETARSVGSAYSPDLARLSARALRADRILFDAAVMLCRHLRLLAGSVERQNAQAHGSVARTIALIVERLAEHPARGDVASEVQALRRRACDATRTDGARRDLEHALYSLASELWAAHETS